MRIAVMGAGGMGGYFGGRLARAGETVAFVARGAHLAAMRASGLVVRSVSGDFTVEAVATDDPGQVPELIGPPELVLFCVKSYDTAAAGEAIAPLVEGGATVLTVQNGVANAEWLARRFGRERVLGGLVYGFAVLEQPGVVVHTQGGRLLFGELDRRSGDRARAFLAAGQRAGFPIELADDVHRALWDKYVMIAALAGMTALTRRPVGEIRGCAESRQMYRAVLVEMVALAAAEGAALGGDAVERNMQALDAWKADTYSSLYHDLQQGRRLELEALHGHAVGLGARHGIPTPTLSAVYAALRPSARAAERRP